MTVGVVAVITAFEPGDQLIDVVRRVIPQTDSVIVVDDGSPSLLSGDDDRVRILLDEIGALGVTVIEYPENRGIAHALNVGVRDALDRGADAVLTLDQDTIIETDYVARVCDHLALARSLGLERVMASPNMINDEVAPFWFAEKGLTLAFEPIQSGLVVTRATYDAVGLFEDELFIDCVDTEFYLRARARDCHALIVPGTKITHSFGQFTSWTPPWFLRVLLRKRRRGPGGEFVAFEFGVGAPFRDYYVARNRTVMYRRYWRTEPLWCAVSSSKDAIGLSRALLTGDRSKQRIYLYASGIRAALSGETGKIPERTLRRAGRL